MSVSLSALWARFSCVRERSAVLVAPLSAEDCCAQSMSDASPAKWHLAHTTWFFETFVLEPRERSFKPFDPAFRVLFNSYYNGVGDKHPRPERGLLTRPALTQVLAYRAHVDQRMQRLLEEGERTVQGAERAELHALVVLGLHHEQQHQELLLTDMLHLLSCNLTSPAYLPFDVRSHEQVPSPLEWIEFPGGMGMAGHDGEGFSFDNERPRHAAYTAPYALADRLVTNAEYADFIENGGYRNSALWLAEAWDWLAAQRIAHPLYWRPAAGGLWRDFGLYGEHALDPRSPVAHLSYFEADAYARWAGVRLPTEHEWEAAAEPLAAAAFSEPGNADRHLAPRAAVGRGLRQLFGELWQWTQSSYGPYPGFRTAPGAVGEYNGKFMVNQYVLRGSSCVTPAGHARLTYRNFFPTTARWQFSGIRLARDI